ncbi:hypothetical protein ACEPAI_4263 [Sanghuangporus weigelae]
MARMQQQRLPRYSSPPPSARLSGSNWIPLQKSLDVQEVPHATHKWSKSEEYMNGPRQAKMFQAYSRDAVPGGTVAAFLVDINPERFLHDW